MKRGAEPDQTRLPRITKRLVEGILKERGIVPVKSIHRPLGHEHIAILISSRGAVLELAKNRTGSRSRGCGWSERSLHAERAVIKKLGDTTLLRGATLIVVRFTNDPDCFNNSYPCESCRSSLEKHIRDDGLRSVYYS